MSEGPQKGSSTPAVAILGAIVVAAVVLILAERKATRTLDAETAALRLQLADQDSIKAAHDALLADKKNRADEQEELEALPGRLKAARSEIQALRNKLAAAARAKRGLPASVSGGPTSDASTLDLLPTVTFQAPPVYPLILRYLRKSGQVMVDFVVDQGGFVRDAKVLSSTDPAFEESALTAVNSWTFTPGQRLGLPVNTHMAVPIFYQINPAPGVKPPPPGGINSPQEWFPTHS